MRKKPAQPDQPDSFLSKALMKVLDRAVASQAGLAQSYVDGLRESNPSDTPADIVDKLQKRYLLAVTSAGTAAGASSAIPGLGTIAAVGAVGAETALFIEATAFYTLAHAHTIGMDVHDQARREMLVLTIIMGSTGTDVLRKALGSRKKRATAEELVSSAMGSTSISALNNRLARRFVKNYLRKNVGMTLGKFVPMGIGAAIGGIGNRKLGKAVIENANQTFGLPPQTWFVPNHNV